jgi:hypothetical protein
MKTILVALSLLMLSACSGVNDSTWFFSGEVNNLGAPAADAAAPPIEVKVVGNGAVQLIGYVTTNCWLDGVTLDGDRIGRTLVLTIERIAQQPCSDVRDRQHQYAVLFSGLREGEYTFRVVNAMGAQPIVELETTLVLTFK